MKTVPIISDRLRRGFRQKPARHTSEPATGQSMTVRGKIRKRPSVLMLILSLLIAGTADAALSEGPGLAQALLLSQRLDAVGVVSLWNTQEQFVIRIEGRSDWEIQNAQVYIGTDPVPASRQGRLIPGKFNYKFPARPVVTKKGKRVPGWLHYRPRGPNPVESYYLVLDLKDDLGFSWGVPFADLRVQNISVHASVVKRHPRGRSVARASAWAYTWDGQESEEGAIDEWSLDELEREGISQGWWFTYTLTHPKHGHFIDSPVSGLKVQTPTHYDYTDESGAFDYFPDETVTLSIGDYVLGTTVADKKISPLDLFEMEDTSNVEVGNIASLLQSLDSDVDPDGGISITPEIRDYVKAAMEELGLDAFDFENSEQIELIINRTIALASEDEVFLEYVSIEDALEHLENSIDSIMFRKNVSKTPLLGSAKAKLNVMGVWFPALEANATIVPGESYPDDPEDYSDPTPVSVEYYDENGDFIRSSAEAKPLVATYTDADPETGAHDVWAAISRDDGNTWKRKNISRMADRSSFTLENGDAYYGHCKKPVFQVKGNKILIAWTSKFARGGRPAYAIKLDDPTTTTNEDDYVYDNDYYTDDIWGVSGAQRSVDYAEQDYPEVGEVPYSAVWIARGIIATESDVSKGLGRFVGDIVWFKPERLTSGRRDANQVFMGGADSAGFAISWQEDPEGLRPGEAKGPGPGWGGATTSHKTDIWYSYITWSDFAKVDWNFVSGGDPEHNSDDFTGRPKALVPMSLPVRISDNDVVNTDNMWIELDEWGLPLVDADGNFYPIINTNTSSDADSDGSHRYGYMLDDLWNWDGNIYYEGETNDWVEGNGGPLFQFTNQKGETKTVVVTADGRALDGNTGAARPNLFLQTYTKPDGTKSAWAIMAYEESKGVGLGPDENAGDDSDGTSGGDAASDGSGYDPYETFPDEGKNAIYHSFDFQNPDLVSAGTILNLQETDELGELIYVTEPEYLGSSASTDADGNTVYTPIPNPLAGTPITDWKNDLIPAYENARRPRFILQSKSSAFGGIKSDGSFKDPDNSGTVLIVLYKEGEEGAGRPSDIMARRCVVKDADGNILTGNPWAPKNLLPGAQNVSTMTPLETWINPERDETAKGEGVKVCRWEQPESNLELKSGENPYEDARAHRGQIRGDFVIMGYSYTPNWAASRNAHDKYDFYIRRSFDGGATWTTDAAATQNVDHTDIFIDPEGVSGSELTEEGDDESEATKHYEVVTSYEPGVYEPARNVSLIQNNKTSVIEPRIVAVPGTIKKNGSWTGIAEDKQNPDVFYLAYGTSTNLRDVEKAPEDLFYCFSTDRGTTLVEDTWEVNPDSSGNYAGETVSRWARLAKGDAEQGEVQLRMTPDGSRFYSCWLQELAVEDEEDPTHFEGSDIWFRRIAPIEFPANDGTP